MISRPPVTWVYSKQSSVPCLFTIGHVCARTCQAQKPLQTAPGGLMGRRPTITKPWQLISADLMEFPRSSSGNEYLLVVNDYFSKYVVVFPLRTAVASKITSLMKDHIFLVYGVPQYIICDNDKQFVSKDFQKLNKDYNVEILYNANYHPQNNPTERMNRIVKTMIRTYLTDKDNHRLWDKYLPEISLAVNTSVHEITQFTPFSINFGREHILSGNQFPRANLRRNTLPQVDTPTPLVDFENIYAEVSEALLQAYRKNKVAYDKGRRSVTYQLGQEVWKRNYVLSRGVDYFAAKLAPKFVGPYLIKEIKSPVTYRLVDYNDKDAGVWHVKDLKPVVGDEKT